MKILVVGGAGYIGSHTVLALLEAGFAVTVYDNLSTGCKDNIFHKTSFVQGDILDYNRLKGVLKKGFTAVIHLAALKAAGESMLKPELYATNNITGTINLLNACLETGINYFIFSSSAAIFGEPQYTPVDEKHPQKPLNFYGFTKLNIEELLAWYSKLKGIYYISLRYFNAAGYDPELRVRAVEKSPQNLLPIIMEVAIGKRPALSIFGNDYLTRDGTCIRDYIHVTDLASAHVASLKYLLEKKESEVFNLGSERGVSVLEMLKAARRITAREIVAHFSKRRPGDSPSLIASSQKAKAVLGWKPRYSDLDTIISTTWEVYRLKYA